MKVTSNLSFLLCIGTIAMPGVIDASSLNGLKHSLHQRRGDVFDFAAQQSQSQSHRGLKSATTAIALLSERSAAAKRAAKNQKAKAVLEVAVHQQQQQRQRRSLQTDLQLDDAACEILLTVLYGPNSGCPCTDEEPSMECIEFVSSNCLICDTIQSEEACLASDYEASLAASPETGSSSAECVTYRSGPFANDTICQIENFSDDTCTFTINETECTSCALVACDGETNYDIDCSNIIAGETWNLCTDDVPETSPFIAFGNSGLFGELTCANAAGDESCVGFKSCDTLQGEQACLLIDEDAQLEAEARDGVDNGTADCLTYESGPFVDSTICGMFNSSDSNACTVTMDGTECDSCAVVTCSGADGFGAQGESFDLDCSNVIAGETWNLCTDDIPDTSPFIAFGNNDVFSVYTCISADSEESDGDAGDTSGGVAASSHVISLVGIIIVTCFWSSP